MIDLVKNYTKNFILNLIYKRVLKSKPKKKFIKLFNKPFSIAVIIDSSLNMKINDFNFLTNLFSTSDQNISFLWYKSLIFHDCSNHIRIDDNDIDFLGKINEDYNLFFDRKYDVLINVYQKDNVIMKLLSLKVKHDFSIGFTPVDTELNDIVFDFSPQNVKVFSVELSKYLKIISK